MVPCRATTGWGARELLQGGCQPRTGRPWWRPEEDRSCIRPLLPPPGRGSKIHARTHKGCCRGYYTPTEQAFFRYGRGSLGLGKKRKQHITIWDGIWGVRTGVSTSPRQRREKKK